MFRESINLENVEKGVIHQLDNVKLSFSQMLGRVVRSKLPEMHLVILKNTKDEDYLKKVIADIDEKYIKIKNY